jgi:hypothetical protein
VLRYPGGDSAVEMLQAAVAASRVIHPNLVGVYDAIDEQQRAYVVREWVDGRSLRELVAEHGPLDPTRATSVAHAIAGAVAAIHATGMVHGNVHPGTTMVGDDGRVVLADARTDGEDTPESDVRAIGGILYYAMTGHWPHSEVALLGGTGRRGRVALPDAVRDAAGSIAAPRQVRAGVPAYLDDLTMDLLDSHIGVPSSDVLAAELGRLDISEDEQYLENAGPLRFTMTADPGREPSQVGGRKVLVGIAGLLTVALVGLVFGIGALADSGTGDDNAAPTPARASASPSAAEDPPVAPPRKVPLGPDQVRVIDPDGNRSELRDVEKAVDGDPNEGWSTESYFNRSNFGNAKEGMGILIDLKEPREVTSVEVLLSTTGATAQLLTGTIDTPSTNSGDRQLVDAYKKTPIGEPFEQHSGSTMAFSAFEPDQTYQYLLVWITDLPPSTTEAGRYKVGIQEITVQAR